MTGRARAACLAAIALSSAAGCAGATRQIYTPADLRSELATRGAALPPADVVVPFELPPAALASARRLVRNANTDVQRVELLLGALFDPGLYGLRYESAATTTGAEALLAGRGNCVALASVFIGLARHVGLDARYIDASSRVHETRYGEDGTTVNFGHVTAMVMTGQEKIGLDFEQVGPFTWYRVLDDLEALAHFYNNRGYERVDLARQQGGPPDWGEAARQFGLAVAVKPTFARAWNNLGIAAAQQGRPEEARRHYQQAIALDPALSAPHANLGALALKAGDLPAALDSLVAASRLDPAGAHIQYNLAVALLRSGDRGGAIRALQRTLSLRGSYPGAQALLERLSPGAPGAGGG
ncbi:MAG: tetratricopeptide repeat protein [Anaeromyxobacter sp.]|nr:tetratricopeptide repeat protein [Anaeromyxobacter sp.]